MVENFITNPWNRPEKSVVHLIQRNILEAKDSLGVVVRDHHAVHVANPHLETFGIIIVNNAFEGWGL